MERKESEYMNELEAAMRMRPSRPAIALLLTIITFILFIIIWAAVSEVEELTRAQGQVVPSQEIQVVQSLEGGILQDLLVQEGDLVKKGQILLRISDVMFSSEERGTEARFMSLAAKKARLQAESSGKEFVVSGDIKAKIPDIVENEKALYLSRQSELNSAYKLQDEKINMAKADLGEVKAQINRLSQSRKSLKKELSITKSMVAKRAVPKLDQIRLERELSDVSGQINVYVQEKKGLGASLKSAENERKIQLDKFRSVALEELNEVETQIASLKENLKSMGDRVDRAEIRAPVDGIVNKITIKTIGGVIEPAMKLIEVVPVDNELKIVAKVKPEEIAFLKVGLAVKVKISAYDPQIYGSLDGKLTRIAANSVTDRDGNVMFEVEVRTDRNYLGSAERQLPVTAGMVATVEVITGKRTILHYLLKPFHRGLDRAFRER